MYYITFDAESGSIYGITNEQPLSGAYIEVDEKFYINAVENPNFMGLFYVEFDTKENQHKIKSIIKETVNYDIREEIYEITDDGEDTVLIITQDCNNKKWKLEFTNTIREYMKYTNASKKMLFSITKKHDPHILIRTIHTDTTKIANGCYIDFEFETEEQEVSIYTKKNLSGFKHVRI